MGVAIVAIPSADDYVWKLSSEKVPHLTLLFLGDNVENLTHVEKYVGHVVNTSASKFGMDVERRGVLGDQEADVLFFGEYGRNRIENVRRYLLVDPHIQKAYNQVDQFPEWIPHLTLGYPETPANLDDREFHKTTWVSFDRIALWTGEYEGVEFLLKNNDDALSMADRGRAHLAHYGVKGMKWGIRRDNAVSGGKRAATAAYNYAKPAPDAVRAKKIKTRAKVVGVDALSNQDLQGLITRMNLERQFSELKQVEQAETYVGKGKKWAGNFINDVLKDAASSWLKRPGSNFSGRTSGRAYSWGQQVGGAIGGTPTRKVIEA